MDERHAIKALLSTDPPLPHRGTFLLAIRTSPVNQPAGPLTVAIEPRVLRT